MVSPIDIMGGPANLAAPTGMSEQDPPFSRMQVHTGQIVPLGWNPAGGRIVSLKDLPELPIPQRVVITRMAMEIDGWVFPFSNVSKGILKWLQVTFVRWAKIDASVENKQWIEAILEAYEDGLTGNFPSP